MRQKTHLIRATHQEQKKWLYDQLQGWNNDAEDLSSCNNLLKILEKKITFPVLQNIQNIKKKNIKKLETLPAVLQISKRKQKHHKIIEDGNLQPMPIINLQKLKQPKQEKLDKNHIFSNSKKQKIKIKIPQNKPHINEQISSNELKTRNKSTNHIKATRNCLKSIDSQSQQLTVKQKTKRFEKLRPSHKKISSMAVQFVKSKLATFDQYGAKQQKQQNTTKQKESHKRIKWDRFSLSQQKFLTRQQPNKSSQKFITKNYDIKTLKLKQGSKQQQDYAKMIWLEKILQKNQFFSKRRIIKTQTNDFMDQHLQSPIPKARLHTNH